MTTVSPPTKRVKLPFDQLQKLEQTASPKQRKHKQKSKPVKPGGAEETGYFDTVELLGPERLEQLKNLEANGINWRKEAEQEWGSGATGKDITVDIIGMSAHGDGLALLTPSNSELPTRVLTIPFTLPGEQVRVHLHRHELDYFMSHGDLLEIIKQSPQRALGESESPVVEEISEELKQVQLKFGPRVKCKYFGACSGCQYQPLAYADQLSLKQNVMRKAFANFSKLDPALIPEIGETLPSPLQYGYRTKLTPHFQAPPTGNSRGKKVSSDQAEKIRNEWKVTIGFEEKGRKRIIDIEECVIATQVINEKLVTERERVKANISSYKRGATLLLRDSLPPRPIALTTRPEDGVFPKEEHICITDHHETVREQVGSVEFEQVAGSFFQNNNSILPSLLEYVSNVVKSCPPVGGDGKRYLVDAYCGSGLFAVSLAESFDFIEGVEIDPKSVEWAKKNAEFNKDKGRGAIGFRAGVAEKIFGDIHFPADQTTILIDPPRKGCDEKFLDQLLAFNPRQIIYISCNIHTQARDIGYVVTKSSESGNGFKINSLRAADLFANTHHAEGVAVLSRQVNL